MSVDDITVKHRQKDAQKRKRFYRLTGEGSTILRRELENLDDIVRHAKGIDLHPS